MPYQRAKLYDATVTLIQRDGKTIPAIVSDSDNGEFTGIDDKFPIIIYHRVTDSSEELLDGVGDSETETRETIQMLMVVASNRERSKIKGVDLARYIKAGFRSSLTASEINTTGISQVLIETKQTDLNRQSVIDGEYADLRQLPSNYDVFSITYEIQITIDKNCLVLCEA